MKKLILVLGGEKSGKSHYALMEGESATGPKAFVATAVAIDEEMKQRIERHKKERSSTWQTFEEPLRIAELIESVAENFEIILVDCLTIWISNLFYHGKEVDLEVEKLLDVISKKRTNIIIVSNEVGLGIVPETEVGRNFRTVLGTLNQKVAKIADKVVFMIAGISLVIKNKIEEAEYEIRNSQN
ncbi:MAG: bifunctional adenosylcobinamide kinase/adenosylcobinamide-phosphate guanylyltransferase [Deltaproteobacteria bacterium]|nr:bifunctional adenosylcobinamide kinase/adenosylcobinamide-phosphate guanylyltransferase [Deltaproteobacteria bacterium]